MKYIKTFEEYLVESEMIKEAEIVDPDLEDIRYFRGSILQFKDFWERKMGVPFNPHGEVEYKYPKERKEDDKSLPYQDFINGKSPLVQHSLDTRRRGLMK